MINRIAIIDDDEICQFLHKEIILKSGVVGSVKEFSNGLDAIKFLQVNHSKSDVLPEIIFLDLNMPTMDGFAFIEAYKKVAPTLHQKIKIFVLSSSVAKADIDCIKGIPEISEYIVKPLKKAKFEEIVKMCEVNRPVIRQETYERSIRIDQRDVG